MQHAGHFRLRQVNADHGSVRHSLHDPPAESDDGKGVFELQDACDAGRCIFAEAVSGHSGGHHAPGRPQSRERVFGQEDSGQLQGGQRELFGGGVLEARPWKEQFADRGAQSGLHELETLIDGSPIGGLTVIQAAAHVGVLRAATREHEHDGRGLGGRCGRGHWLAELRDRILTSDRGRGEPEGKLLATVLQRPGDVAERRI